MKRFPYGKEKGDGQKGTSEVRRLGLDCHPADPPAVYTAGVLG